MWQNATRVYWYGRLRGINILIIITDKLAKLNKDLVVSNITICYCISIYSNELN